MGDMGSGHSFPKRTTSAARHRKLPWRAVLYLLIPGALAIGLLGSWSWLVIEHQRLEPLEVLEFWASAFIACFWYLYFGIRRLFLADQTDGRGDEYVTSRLSLWLVTVTFTLGVAFDLTVAIRMHFAERAALARAVQVEGQLTDATVVHYGRNKQGKTFILSCRFQDRGKAWHSPTFVLHETLHHAVPPAIVHAVNLGRLPCPIRVAYDPERPTRSWAVGDPDPHGNRLPMAGFSFQVCSFVVALNLIAFAHKMRTFFVPVEVAPFVGVTIPLFVLGVVRLLTGY